MAGGDKHVGGRVCTFIKPNLLEESCNGLSEECNRRSASLKVSSLGKEARVVVVAVYCFTTNGGFFLVVLFILCCIKSCSWIDFQDHPPRRRWFGWIGRGHCWARFLLRAVRNF